MKQPEMIIRVLDDPRAVELEVSVPAEHKTVGPFDDTLRAIGIRPLGTVVFTASRRITLRTKLIEFSGHPLDPNRIGVVLEALRAKLFCSPLEAAA